MGLPEVKQLLVGIDGSSEALAAALWTVEEAALRSALVRLLAVSGTADPDEMRGMVRSAVQQCRHAHREVDIVDEVVPGFPAEELVRRSTDAQLLVVGSRGRGSVAEALLGSVSITATREADCPVVVIRRRRTSSAPGPVVVGVHAPQRSGAVLRFAFEEAVLRRAALHVVHVRRPTTGQYSWTEPAPLTLWSSAEDVRDDIAAHLSSWRKTFPDVPVRVDVRCGSPSAQLADAASMAQVLVIGHRESGAGLGMVVHGALHRAECPVAVVRGSAWQESESGADARSNADEP
ncbi:universal stress protein [Saccharopolyspora sp. NPDC002376]